jgi:phosphatase NudJ
MGRPSIPSFAYVLVVVERARRFLLVEERKHGGYYLPAGGVEVGETLVQAAVRETLEEAGVFVTPTGLLGLDQQWIPGRGGVSIKWRFVLTARVEGDPTPKSTPDRHSLGARWVDADLARTLPLRHPEVVEWIDLAWGGARTLPLERYNAVGLSGEAPTIRARD